MEQIYSRRSIRKYKNEPVSKEMITDILSAGKAAPSAKNRQPWKYIVFADAPKTKLLDSMELGLNNATGVLLDIPQLKAGLADAWNTLRIMREAPVIIIVLNTNGTSPFIPTDANGRITEICDTLSIGASIQNILLKAAGAGLGTLWIANTSFAYKEITDFLDTDCQLVGAIALGYPDESPLERPRKPLDEIVEFRY